MSASASHIVNLDYSKGNEALLSLIAALPLPVVLESNGESGASDQGLLEGNRYTILCANPVESYCLETEDLTSNIFSKIRELKSKYLSLSEPLQAELAVLPFQGGVAGYIGYPTLRGKAELAIDKAFFGVYLWAIVVDHQLGKTCLAVHPNCPDQSAADIRRELAELHNKPLEPENEAVTNFTLKAQFKNETEFKNYEQAFEKVKKYIQQGDCYQVNLTQKFSAQCQGDPFDAYMNLRRVSPAPFSAFIRGTNDAVISLSPERFLLNRQGQIETRPIKGTSRRDLQNTKIDEASAEQLSSSEKDRAENLMIVDLLRNDLGKISNTGSVKVSGLFRVESFSNVHHLVSTITSTLASNYDSIDMLSSCFPGGSITGAPKLRAMEVIEEVEDSNRGPYCGSIFYWASNGDFDSNIAIRTLYWQAGQGEQDSIDCWAGGGIVADSSCRNEYQECFDKVQNLMHGLESKD